MTYKYKKNGENYELYNEEMFVRSIGKEIAISYTYWLDEDGRERGFIYKHGSAEDVTFLHNALIAKYNESLNITKNDYMLKEIGDMKSHSFYACGEFEVEELNNCLSTSDYIIKIHNKYFK